MHQMKPNSLKVERELRGWSQARLAEALGTTARTVGRWEQGLALPYPYHRELLCVLFGKTAQELGLPDDSENNDGQEPFPPGAPATATQASFLTDPAIPEALGGVDSLLGRDGLLLQVKQRLLEDNHPA